MSHLAKNSNTLLAGHRELVLHSGKMDRGIQLFLDHVADMQEHSDQIGSLAEVCQNIFSTLTPFSFNVLHLWSSFQALLIYYSSDQRRC